MRYLITGHTGFKGAWFSILLKELGHEVYGFSNGFESDSLYCQAELSRKINGEYFGDIRKVNTINSYVLECQPDFHVHFAAQSLVRESYRNPQFTFETNVLGTFNYLKAIQASQSYRGVLIITTDKVYENIEKMEGYNERDELGGIDPYSSSKSIADLICQSWMEMTSVPIAIARAGNVIGGGDRSKERLLPDIVKALINNDNLKIRSPHSVRPWQHILDCLSGYLKIIEDLINHNTKDIWNVGPSDRNFKSVKFVVDKFLEAFGSNLKWELNTSDSEMIESKILTLDTTKIRKKLGWEDKLTVEQSILMVANWERKVLEGTNPYEACIADIKKYGLF